MTLGTFLTPAVMYAESSLCLNVDTNVSFCVIQAPVLHVPKWLEMTAIVETQLQLLVAVLKRNGHVESHAANYLIVTNINAPSLVMTASVDLVIKPVSNSVSVDDIKSLSIALVLNGNVKRNVENLWIVGIISVMKFVMKRANALLVS